MYRAPLREMRFVLEELLGSGRLGGMRRARRLLGRAGAVGTRGGGALCARTCSSRSTVPGTCNGARWTPEGVVTAPGFREAYQQFVAGGWPALGAAAGVRRPAACRACW